MSPAIRARTGLPAASAAVAPFVALVAFVALVTGCGSGALRSNPPAQTPTSGPASSTTPATTTPATTSPAATPATTVAPFAYTISTVTAADLPHSWHPGCPVAPSELRMIRLAYWGFDSQAHTGSIVVAAAVTGDVVTVFRKLFQARFPIHEMVPVDVYGGDDNAAAAADDTSGFNCRYAVTNPPSNSWSVHAFGEAIDVNDVENPYVDGSTIIPPSGAAYLNRADVRPGMAEPGGVLVDAFASVGWPWGGRWDPGTDYQHFSKTGG